MRMGTGILAGAAAAAMALGGCSALGIRVRPTGLQVPARSPDCVVQFLRAPPDRPYDEVADLESHVTVVPREGPEEVFRAKACALGADAVIITKSMVLNELGHVLLAGTAIVYRPQPAPEQPKSLSL